ncbi:hypothetical protein TNCV_299211 [Trichonephila clavipes]|nr:hypothetical protein TNCV_299211 [Trichonephila clavipes]
MFAKFQDCRSNTLKMGIVFIYPPPWKSISMKPVFRESLLNKRNMLAKFTAIDDVDIWGNEEAEALAKKGAREALATSNCLAYHELYSDRKYIDKKTWFVPRFTLGIELTLLVDPLL